MGAESVDGLLKDLEIKLQHIADLYVKAREERDLLINQSVIQKRTIEEQDKEIQQFKSQVRGLDIDRTEKPDTEMLKVKDRIGDLVREIDRCIELLNK